MYDRVHNLAWEDALSPAHLWRARRRFMLHAQVEAGWLCRVDDGLCRHAIVAYRCYPRRFRTGGTPLLRAIATILTYCRVRRRGF
ncbi:hypothetical protein ACNKHW_27400 [Shigella flexneri]